MVLQAVSDASQLLFQVDEATREPLSAVFADTIREALPNTEDNTHNISKTTAQHAVALMRYLIKQKCVLGGLELDQAVEMPTPKCPESPLSKKEEWCRKVLLAAGHKINQSSFNQSHRGKTNPIDKAGVLSVFSHLEQLGLGQQQKERQGQQGRFSDYFLKIDVDSLNPEDALHTIETLQDLHISIESYRQSFQKCSTVATPLANITNNTKKPVPMPHSNSARLATPLSSLSSPKQSHKTKPFKSFDQQKRSRHLVSPPKPSSSKRLFTHKPHTNITPILDEDDDVFTFK